MIKPNFVKLSEEAFIPTLEFSNDAGVDFYIKEDIVIPPKGSVITDLGLGWNPEWDFVDNSMNIGIYQNETYNTIRQFFRVYFKFSLIVKSRSGRSLLDAVEVANSGVVDEGYRGSIKLKLYNNSDLTRYYYKGDKIAQGLILIQPRVVGIKPKKSGERDIDGFGSTGGKHVEA